MRVKGRQIVASVWASDERMSSRSTRRSRSSRSCGSRAGGNHVTANYARVLTSKLFQSENVLSAGDENTGAACLTPDTLVGRSRRTIIVVAREDLMAATSAAMRWVIGCLPQNTDG